MERFARAVELFTGKRPVEVEVFTGCPVEPPQCYGVRATFEDGTVGTYLCAAMHPGPSPLQLANGMECFAFPSWPPLTMLERVDLSW